MKEQPIVNNFKYNKAALKLASTLFIGAFIYGIATGKGVLSTITISFIGGLAGFTIASIIKLPEKIN